MSDLQDALDADHAWRAKELVDLRLAVKSDTSLRRSTLVRAGVPLLYAHWEGFIKCASTSYLQFVRDQKLKYAELSDCFIVFGVKRHLNSLTSSKKSEVNIAAVHFFLESLGNQANLSLASAVNTEANLSSTVFENIAVSLGVDPAPYRSRFNLIDESLLRRRNNIAHGEYLDLEADDFLGLVEDVTNLMRCYKNDLSNAASTTAYLR
jgi:hypothetical protein